jgi:hypothetical protein
MNEELTEKLQDIYLEYIFLYPSSNNERVNIYEITLGLLDNNEALREYVGKISEPSVINSILYTLSHHNSSLSGIEKMMSQKTTNQKFIEIYCNDICSKFNNLSSQNKLNADFFIQLISFLPDRKKIFGFLKSNIKYIDIQKYYNSRYIPYMEALNRFDKLKNINHKNIYLHGILYDLICDYERGVSKHDNKILVQRFIDLYKSKNVDISTVPSFSKYNLVEITEDREIFHTEPRIIDHCSGITFRLAFIDSLTLQFITNYRNTYEFKIAFRPQFLRVSNFIDRSVLICDSYEFGSKPTLNDLKAKNTKKIKHIDYASMDTFWVRTYQDNLIFEEISGDFEIHDSSIVSRMVHIQHSLMNNELFIIHIDFEFIFYTLDEFQERYENNNFEQKGNDKKREKIFKIDNAKIPFENNFIYPLIYSCFINKELVDEYFVGS